MSLKPKLPSLLRGILGNDLRAATVTQAYSPVLSGVISETLNSMQMEIRLKYVSGPNWSGCVQEFEDQKGNRHKAVTGSGFMRLLCASVEKAYGAGNYVIIFT